MSEHDIMNRVQVAVSKLKTRVFRNNVGVGWTGQRVSSSGSEAGTVVLRGARPLRAGLGVGSSDLIGWTPVDITEEMIGKTVAVFTALEIKSSLASKPTKEQQNFLSAVKDAGGIAVVARSVEDAERGINEFRGVIKTTIK